MEFQNGHHVPERKILIYKVAVKLKELFEQGRSYKWPKPDICPRCGKSHVWGHGFVLAFFDGFSHGLYLRRWRCPECGCVIRMKPTGYFNRFQASIENIRHDLCHRVETGRWPPGLSGPRRRHWKKALIRNIRLYLGNGLISDVIRGFDILLAQGRVPVSRAHLI